MKAVLAELMTLDREALARRWEAAFGTPPPDRVRPELLRQGVAWHLQSTHYGHGSIQRQLRGRSSAALTPGSRLIRVWKDETHQVTVLASGFLYNQQTYKSLSAIAKRITGTPWSGPVFFGVKS